MPVLFHRLADDEYVRASRAYARQDPDVARRFRNAVESLLADIEAAPAIGAPIFQGYRWRRVRPFSYVLYYRELSADTVLIYAVAHTRRRPGYWLRRPGRP
jgi:toxin ParE1/3/4